MVGDDDVGLPGLPAGLLGEAVGAIRTAGHAEAFPRRHTDLRPGPFRHPRSQVITVAGFGGRRPLGQPCDVAAQRADRRRREQLSWGGSWASLPLWILLRHR